MNKAFLKKKLYFGIILVSVIGLVLTVKDGTYAQNSKKMGNLNFQVPDDWPVEKRGGLLTPVPTEEYVTIKFKEIEKEFQDIRNEFSERLGGFESDLKDVEGNFLKEIKKLQSQDVQQSGPSGDSAELLSNLKSLESELARLDRKVMGKIKEIESRLEEMEPRLKFIGEHIDGLQTQIYRIDEKVDYFGEDQRSSN